MQEEKIKVCITDTGNFLEIVVLNKQASRIEVVLGAGIHSVRCELLPTRSELAYSGRAMGREIVYERSRKRVQADLDRINPTLRDFRRR